MSKKNNQKFYRTQRGGINSKELVAAVIEALPEIKKVAEQLQRDDRLASINSVGSGRLDYMYDFYSNYDGSVDMDRFQRFNPLHSELSSPENPQPAKRPKDVFDELQRVPNLVVCENLDEKIELLKRKTTLAGQPFVEKQLMAMIECLENRKKYAELREFFDGWQYTTTEAVDDLVSKYKFRMEKTELFIPSFPEDAIKAMEEYTEAVKKVNGKNPVYYVIAEEKDFQEKRKKLDPILLVQSPFGFFWQILGAWDKELVLLSEL